jgi:cytidine deaminase
VSIDDGGGVRRPAGGAAGALADVLTAPGFRGVVRTDDAQAALASVADDPLRLMLDLVPAAAALAAPAISGYAVGAVLQGEPAPGAPIGPLYLGANMEFPGQALSFSTHAEQSAVVNAWAAGEARPVALAVSAPPCGYCRQFLSETTTGCGLVVALPGRDPALLADYLPGAFGPADLGVTTALLEPQHHALVLADPTDDPVTVAALDAARRSYAPYTSTFAGVAVQTASGAVHAGRYAENAAYSPSMSPLQAALALARLAGESPGDVRRAVLAQTRRAPADQRAATAAVLDAIGTVALEVAWLDPA